MKTLVGTLAAIAVYIILWFISTVFPVKIPGIVYLILMPLAFVVFYFMYEHFEKTPEWLDKALKNQ
jgi:hypothetical protein